VTAPLSCRRPYYALEAVKRYPGRFAVVGMDEGQHRPCLNPSFSLPVGTSRAPDTKVRESRPARSQPLFLTADYTPLSEDAGDLARKHRPDLILMDIQLPEVSGLEVTKWLKEDSELKVIPVVAVTAFAMKGDERRIREGGCEAYLSKPIPVPEFIETVRRFLGGGLSMPAVSQPAAVGAAAPSPLHHRAPHHRIRRGRARGTV
jgi:two-component system, cell cycle response regulator DivK